MASVRTYGESCAAAHALDLVGERWALLIVRELLLGPKRFTDLQTGIRNASPNVLAHRLRELERVGVVQRRTLPPPAASRVYELTGWGHELEPVIIALGRFGARSPLRRPDAGMSVDSHILALTAIFDSGAAAGLEGSYELRLGEDSFGIEISGGQIQAGRALSGAPDAVIETDPGTLTELLWAGRELAEAERSGEARVEGDRDAAERLLGLFPLPEVAPVAG